MEAGDNTQFVKKRFIFPRELIPTGKTSFIFGTLFLAILMFGLVQLPLGSFSGEGSETSMKIGWPFPFLELSFSTEKGVDDSSPFKIPGLMLDILIYLLIGYMLDVTINVFWKKLFNKKVPENNPKNESNILIKPQNKENQYLEIGEPKDTL